MGAELALYGLSAGLNFLNNGLNVGFGELSRARNYYYGERQAANADARTRALYNDLYSPKALMKQYKEAGLSPSVMFGGTPGQGGMSGAMASSAAVQTPYMPMSMLEAAQAANIMADTEKKNAETEKTEVEKSLVEAQTKQQEWQNYITSNTADISINTAYSLAEQAANAAIESTFHVISAEAQAKVDEATIESRVAQAEANVKYTNAQELLAKSGVKLNEANEKRAIAEINKWREELKIEWKELYKDLYNASTERMKWRTMDEHMVRSMHALQGRLDFDKDLQNRQFLWTMVNDTYNNMLNTVNAVTPAAHTSIVKKQ